MLPSLVMVLNKPAPTSYWGNSSVVICWEDSFTWLWWNKKRWLACIYNVLIEVTHLMVYTPTGIIFELLLDVWPPTIPQYYTLEWKLWTISYEIFPSPCLTSINYIFECKLKVISCEVLLDVWPPSTLFLNEYSWPLVTRNFLIFHLSQPYIECKLSIIRFELLLDLAPPSTL